MKRFTVAFAIAFVAFFGTMTARAQQTHQVVRGERVPDLLGRYRISFDELLAANRGKLGRHVACIDPTSSTISLNPNNPRVETECERARIRYYLVAGTTLTIPESRAAVEERMSALERQLADTTARLGAAEAALAREREARVSAQIAAERERGETRVRLLSEENAKLREELTTSTWLGILFGIAGTALVVVMILFNRSRRNLSREKDRADQAEEQIGMAMNAQDMTRRELDDLKGKWKTRESELTLLEAEARARQAQADAREREAGEKAATLEATRLQLEKQQTDVQGQRSSLEEAQRKLVEEDIPRIEAEANARAEQKLADEFARAGKLVAQYDRTVEELRPILRTEVMVEFEERERRLREETEALEAARENIRKDWDGVERHKNALDKRAGQLEEKDAQLEAAWADLSRQGLVAPRPKTQTQPMELGVVAPSGERDTKPEPHEDVPDMTEHLLEEEGEQELSGERTRVAPDMRPVGDKIEIAAELAGDVPAEFDEIPDRDPRAFICRRPGCNAEISYEDLSAHTQGHQPAAGEPRGRRSTQRGLGGNGVGGVPVSDEDATRKVELPGLRDYSPKATTETSNGVDLTTCECGAPPMEAEDWEPHRQIGHLQCTHCSPPVVILATHRSRHIKRAHPDLAERGLPRPKRKRESRTSGE